MPKFTPFNKIKHTRGFGAWVVLEGATLTEPSWRAEKIAVEENLVFVHPYDDPKVRRPGTVALEMLADAPDLDTAGGADRRRRIESGHSVAAKALKPVSTFTAADARLSLHVNAIKGEALP